MKKLCFIIVFIFISTSVFAQHKWEKYYNNYVNGTSSYNEYTWFVYYQDFIRINQITKEVIKIEKPKGCYSFYSYIAINNELWLSSYGTGKLFHYKNGNWIVHQLNTNYEYKFSSIHKPSNRIVITANNGSEIILVDGDSLKTISIQQAQLYKCAGKAILTNANTIIYDLSIGKGIVEINTDGNLLNYINASKIIPNGYYNNIIGLNSNNNLILETSEGIYKAIFNLNDTSFVNIISKTSISSIIPNGYAISSNNEIMVYASPYLDTLSVVYFNDQGIKTYQSNIYNSIDKQNVKIVGYDYQNRPIGIYNYSNLIYCDSNKIIFIYKDKSEYIGDDINYTCFINKEVYLSGSHNHYTIHNDSLSITQFDTLINLTDAHYRAMISDDSSNLFIVVKTSNNLILFKKIKNNKAKFVDYIPTKLNDITELDGNGMYFDNNNRLNILMKKYVLIYNPTHANKWDSITNKVNSNLVAAQYIYSFAKDAQGTIWFATNRGIAKTENGFIVVQTNPNIPGIVLDIKYDYRTNSIIAINEYSNNNSFYIYNLNTNSLSISSQIYDVNEISLDSNSRVYLSTYQGIIRYNLLKQEWDSVFNNNTSNTAFSKKWPYVECNNSGDLYLFSKITFSSSNTIYIYYESLISTIQNDIYNTILLTLYPNPSTGIITINGNKNYRRYSVYNTLGEFLKNGEIENNIIDISELSSGVYTLKLIGNKGERIRRIVKN